MTAGVFRLSLPARQETPVIFASPHSGAAYLPDFLAQSVLNALQIRSSEDAFVDQLLADAPTHGAALLVAEVPRAYLDLNRAPDELDPAVIEGITRPPHNPRVSSGLGVIPRVVSGGRAIYRGKLTRTEAEARITRFWHPYHRALRDLVEATHSRFGQAILIDCHSMPSGGAREKRRMDFVIGDRYGASAARPLVEGVEERLKNRGYHVLRNRPYAGGFITEHFGRPAMGWHAVQIEVSRGLYMDETQLSKKPEFAEVVGHLAEVIAGLAQDIEREAVLGAPRAAAE